MTKEQKLYHYQGSKDLLEDTDEIEAQRISISSFLKHSLRSSNLVIFCSSGCSVGAIPMMGQTMEKILEENPNVKEKFEIYQEISGAENDDIEGFLNWLQNGIAFECEKEKKNLKTVFKIVQDGLIGTMPEYGSEQYKNSTVIDTYSKFYQEIYKYRKEESDKLPIFTLNYDLFSEYALENNNISYTTGFTTDLTNKFDINQFKYRLVDNTNRYKNKWQPVKKEANLFKIHGSINWVQDESGNLYQRHDAKEKVVIYPTQLKHQETTQTPYSELFREFANVLQKPNTTLIVMGYGFPDQHVNTIISQNLKNSDFNLIVFGDMKEEKLNEYYKNNMKNNFHIVGGNFSGGERSDGHYFNIIVDEYLGNKEEKSDE